MTEPWLAASEDLLKSGPCSLEKQCTRQILDHILLSCGRKIEDRARVIQNGGNNTASQASSTTSEADHQDDLKKRKRRSSTTILTLDSEDDSTDFYTQTQYFQVQNSVLCKMFRKLETFPTQEQASKCRQYLSTHLSSCALDNLVSEVQQLNQRSGFFFALSSLCSDRLSHLPISTTSKAAKANRKVCKTFQRRPSTLELYHRQRLLVPPYHCSDTHRKSI